MIRGAVKLQEIRELGVPKRLSPCAQVDGALLALPVSAATQLTSGSNAAHRANQVQLCGQRAGCNGPASYMLLQRQLAQETTKAWCEKRRVPQAVLAAAGRHCRHKLR